MSTFVTIARYPYSTEAQIIKGRLEADGITVFLSDNYTIDTDPLVSNAIGGVKLKVIESQKDKALKIVQSIQPYSVDDNGNPINCPNCNSTSIQLFSTVTNFKSLFWFIFGLLFSALPFYAKFDYKCEACNTEFNLK